MQDPLIGDTQPAPAPVPEPEKPKAPKQVKVRVLTACCYGQANDVATIGGSELKSAKAEGLVDDAPAAVAYAESLAAAAAAGDDTLS